MGRVASLGSVNVDHVEYASTDWIRSMTDRYEWFPAAGETVTVDRVPPDVAVRYDERHLGGKGANQAVAAAVAGADASLVGMVGTDESTYDVRERLSDRGVDVSAVGTADGPTGAAYVAVDETGENYIAIVPGANGEVDPAYVRGHVESLLAVDCLLVQNELPTDAVLAALDALADRPDRPTVIYDPAPTDGAERILRHDCVDVVTPNETEYERLRAAVDAFGGVVVRTRGARAVLVEGESRFRVVPPAVDVVDTTGAGDVFDGYLGAVLADGGDVDDAVRLAAAAGALSTRAEGVQDAVPSRSAVEAAAERSPV
jgi:ribokinase